MEEFNFTPVVNRNSVFNKLPIVYMYIGHHGDIQLHLYEGFSNLGFNETMKVNFMVDEEKRKIFMFTDSNYGQKITKIKENHFSIKCPIELKSLNIKPLPPKKDGKQYSGKYILCEKIKYSKFEGVVIDINQFETQETII